MGVLKHLVSSGKNNTIEYKQPVKPYHNKIAGIVEELNSESIESIKILDVGCGVGNTIVSIMNRVESAEFHIADIDKECLDICESIFTVASSTLMKDISTLVDDNESKFDIVIYSHVLQYEPNPLDALNMLMTLIKPGGHLIVAASNAVTPIKILNGIIRKKYSSGIYTWDRPTIKNLADQLLDTGNVAFHYDYVPLPIIYRYRAGQFVGRGLVKLLPWLSFSLILSVTKN